MVSALLNSGAFQLFQDEALRRSACTAVDFFLENNSPVKNAQVRSIPSIVRAKGQAGLKKLIENQAEKNSKNKEFWLFMTNLILANPGPDYSLQTFLRAQPIINALLKDETSAADKKGRNVLRKANKEIMSKIIDHILPVYFEHFNCHYRYRTRQGD